MSSLLALLAPVPVTELEFERLFAGSDTYDTLIALSQARRAASRAARELNDASADAMNIDVHVTALRAYSNAWYAFSARAIYARGAAARTSLPFEVAWHVSLPGAAACIVRDTSPVLETACATLALAAALQRRGAVDAHAADLPVARDTLTTLARAVLVPLHVPRADSGDAEVLSPVVAEALAAAIDGQQAVKRAIVARQRNEPVTKAVALLFTATRAFRRAAALRYGAFDDALGTTGALAHRYAAEALLDAAPSDTERGVAVALARRAHAIDPANATIAAFATDLEERNRLEFGMQAVPAHESLTVIAAETACAVTATPRETGGWTIEVPLLADGT